MSKASSTQHTPPRYVVGIDLGTTNSAVTFVDSKQSPWKLRTFAVPQLVAPGVVESRETLPSFHYQCAEGELEPRAFRCPWHGDEAPSFAVGVFARDHGATVPGRLIASAKSWLCHTGVDRTAALLPWQGAADVERLSPVEVASRLLAHVRAAWDHRFPKDRLAEQDIVLTLPASFDEIARELTVKAAATAGLKRVVLIEEPQAAFYAWICAHANDWQQQVEPGQKILVCDVGGGTSDFTLIRVRRGEAGKVQFHRVAVGEHLILGGDNLDLALAQHVERRLEQEHGHKLQSREWTVLVQRCRAVKETLLGPDPPDRLTVNVSAPGRKLIGAAWQVELTRNEVEQVLLEGFFPMVDLEAKPRSRRSGFQEFGLPYAPDPAITRSLAAFLTAHRHVAMEEVQPAADHDPARPDIVLLNGGLFASPVLRQRLLTVLQSWFARRHPDWHPALLDNERLELAVARGAAYYGMVRRGQGVRIAAGLARTYYIGVESEPPTAVCLLPASIEPGCDVELTQRQFELLVCEPVEFPLYVSSTRLTDKPGELVEIDREQMTPLPPIRTVLRTRKKSDAPRANVNLHARLTEIGTLELWCSEIDGRRSWRLQFDVRSATQTDVAAHESDAESEGFLDESAWQACETLLRETFGPKGKAKPAGLAKRLAGAVGGSRNQWPTSLCRRIWETLMEEEPGRRRSQVHEARWLNLLGFALRPGYGMAVDDWRVAETWRTLQGKFAHASAAVRAEGWILWRRIGGGLAAGQQQAVAEPLLGPVRGLHRQLTTGKGRGGDFSFSSHETAEVWRLLGSLELLGVAAKIELGNMLLDLLPKRKMEPVRAPIIWALGRIGARQTMYGALNTVVPAETVAEWVTKLMDFPGDEAMLRLAVMQIARRTDDRYRELPEKSRNRVVTWLKRQDAPRHFIELVRDGGTLDAREQGLVFGESLPKGLRLG